MRARLWLRRIVGTLTSLLGALYVYAVAIGIPGDPIDASDRPVVGAVGAWLVLIGALTLAHKRPDVVRTSLAALTAAAFAFALDRYEPGPGNLAEFDIVIPAAGLLLAYLLSETNARGSSSDG